MSRECLLHGLLAAVFRRTAWNLMLIMQRHVIRIEEFCRSKARRHVFVLFQPGAGAGGVSRTHTPMSMWHLNFAAFPFVFDVFPVLRSWNTTVCVVHVKSSGK